MPDIYIAVAVNRAINTTFDYVLKDFTDNDHASLIGRRVAIDFAHKKDIGVIVAIKSTCDYHKVKSATLIDNEPCIKDDILQLLRFACRYYHYPLGQCLPLAIPKLMRHGEALEYKEIVQISRLESSYDLKRIKAQGQLKLLAILEDGPQKQSSLRERGIQASDETALIKKGLIIRDKIFPSHDSVEVDTQHIIKNAGPKLNFAQQDVVNAINKAQGFKVFLINGVTGSGKTEVYLHAIEHCLSQGKRALVLVPEIALTPQTFERFYSRFNVAIATMHSALSDRERADAFLDMYYDKARILIGTRSALFTPIKDLGLIVIDEEHDSSFKQNDSLHYHARSLAIMRAKYLQAKIILGSATPSFESLYNAYQGKYELLELKSRASNASMPAFEIIDLEAQAFSEGLKAGISTELEERIGEETAKGNQVLIFLNRRGYSSRLFCHHCQHLFVCPNCDNPLTVHSTSHSLKCHICDYVCAIPPQCPQCHNAELLSSGFGTEKIEEFLQLRYPDLTIARMDRDTVKSASDLNTILDLVSSNKAKILIGTQMLAKGHDFANITLVAIIDIDASLYSYDFRALEQCLQLIVQVAGRAGRSHKEGKVLLQSYRSKNDFIQALLNLQDYNSLAISLLQMRKNQGLPPYASMAYAYASSTDRNLAYAYIQGLNQVLVNSNNPLLNCAQISHVMSDKTERRHNRYYFNFFIIASDHKVLHALLDELTTLTNSEQFKLKKDLRFSIDVDPLNAY